MNDQYKVSVVSRLLSDLYDLLRHHGETNWIRGIKEALAEIRSNPSKEGFENSRSIYRTMTQGGKGFSEYYIWKDDENLRMEENKKLDRMRSDLWDNFDKR